MAWMGNQFRVRTAAAVLALAAGAWVPGMAVAQGAFPAASGPEVSVLRSTDMRSDKLASAPVLQTIAAGTPLRLLSVEGGWAWVELLPGSAKKTDKDTGWVRAGALNLQAASSAASTLSNGREAAGNTALTMGIRNWPTRVNRHALIIGISRYADPATPELPGARIDKQSATQMAQAMQVPLGNIQYLQDSQATGDAIRRAIQELTDRVQQGDRVFIHYSGHGTRYKDPAAGGCVEALLAYDGGDSGRITNHEMADLLKTITNKTDKLFVMYDACHSGGVVQAASSVRTRGISNGNDEGLLRPKFSSISEECGRPVNIRTRGLVQEAAAKGALPQDIIHVSASRDNEISFDDEHKGGLATQYMRDCMLRDAKDLDNSGAISMDEIRACAQGKVNRRMANDPSFKAHNLVLNGNAAFVPAWFSQPSAGGTVTAPVAEAASGAGAAVAALSGEQALRQMFDQRDAKRRVQARPGKTRLKIGQDFFDLVVQSERAGYVYVALAGSDNQSVYMLFPNDLDQNNKIEAGESLLLPRPHWNVQASGPAGTDQLLVMVADAPRNLAPLAASKAGPFVMSLNDVQGRAQLGALMAASAAGGGPGCGAGVPRDKNSLCSDAYGAAMLAVEEIK